MLSAWERERKSVRERVRENSRLKKSVREERKDTERPREKKGKSRDSKTGRE